MKRRFFGDSVIVAVAIASLGWVPMHAAGQDQPAQDRTSVPTPRTADGHPDFSGVWTGGFGNFSNLKVDEAGNVTQTFFARNANETQEAGPVNIERDSGLQQRMSPNRPIYKPEFWDKVQELDYNGNAEDPTFSCKPAGVPRMGPPSKVVQTPTEMIFLYQNRNTFRVIYLDGRSHHPEEAWEGTWMGHSVGRWEGDTLVIDTVDFNDTSWLDWPGYFHSENMRVTERMRRDGNTLTWQATVDDPDVLVKPWVMNPRTIRLNPDSKAELPEDLPCAERSLEHIVTKERG